MYVLLSRSTDLIQRKLAENKARLLILGLGEIAKSWPAATWILRLFETIFRKQHERNPWIALPDSSPRSRSVLQPPLPTNGSSVHQTNSQIDNSMDNGSQHAGRTYPYGQPDQPSFGRGEATTGGGLDYRGDSQMMLPAFNLQDLFDADLFAECPPDIGVGSQDVFPFLMELNSFPEGSGTRSDAKLA